MKATKQSGFHAVEVVLVIVVIAVVGFVGFKVLGTDKNETSPDKVDTSASAPAIESSSDLDSATKTVDEVDTAADLQEIDNLEKDIQSL